MWVLIIVLVLVVLLVVFVVGAYNGLVKSSNQVENAWAQIDVQLKRRLDLIPNLVETVKGYAAHEKETLQGVIDARNKAMTASSVADQAAADNMITGALNKLFALQRGLSGPEGEPELPRPSGGAHGHRGSGRVRAAVLQRQRAEVQHQDRRPSRRSSSPGCSSFTEREYFEADDAAARPRRSSSDPFSRASVTHPVRTDLLQQTPFRGTDRRLHHPPGRSRVGVQRAHRLRHRAGS